MIGRPRRVNKCTLYTQAFQCLIQKGWLTSISFPNGLFTPPTGNPRQFTVPEAWCMGISGGNMTVSSVGAPPLTPQQTYQALMLELGSIRQWCKMGGQPSHGAPPPTSAPPIARLTRGSGVGCIECSMDNPCSDGSRYECRNGCCITIIARGVGRGVNKTEGICQRYARLYACAKRRGKIRGENGGAMLRGYGYIYMPNGCEFYMRYPKHQWIVMMYLNALQNACDGGTAPRSPARPMARKGRGLSDRRMSRYKGLKG